ncbi:kinase suppressor of Ras 2 [Castor canadensis]|uniref:Kinase suppressor of Ras 2 n=2 Tax=Castor canadensis TaxID=51338 RepID=A0AC58LIH7_CASCN
MDEENMTKSEEQQPLSLQKALQQCELVQNMIDLSISNLEGLRTKCATSNDLTQKEIRTLESKLVSYFSRQLSYKKKVSLQERNAELDGFPQLRHWFRIVDVRKEVLEEISPGQLSLEDLLEMTDEQVCETVEKYGANQEECARLNASLSCLRNVHMSGGNLSKQDWTIQWPTTETGKENNPVCPPEPTSWVRTHLSQSPRVQTKCGQHFCHTSPTPGAPVYTHVDRLTVDPYPGLCPPPPLESGHRSLPPSPRQRHAVRTPPRTPNIVTTVTPPGTPPMRRKNKLKPPGTPPPSSRKLIHLIPGFTALHRSKSHEFQLGHRVDEAHTPKLHTEQGQPRGVSHFLCVPGSRKAEGPSVRHTCNSGNAPGYPRVTRTVSSGSQDHISVPYQPDSSSNPSSTTSSTPSSPAPPLPPSATPPSPLHPSPQCTRQPKNFNLPASHYYKYKQQFIFPDVVPVPETPTRAPQVILHPVASNPILEGNPLLQIEVEPTSENEEGHEEAEESEDDFEEMNLSLLSARSFPRKASQTSIFLQEWDIPFEQLEVGELIGKGRFGQVYHGRWHGEVAIRLIDVERDNEDQLKAFKREVMAYRQTRHENVVLFMGACMSPPHLAIITSLCKGRTLYSVVRDAKIVLDVNKTRQIAQEIVKGMGYLHAKGILHKDLKSKNVFYDNGKVVITDFGLFSISGVLQAGRREDKLRIQNGWLCHLAPEIIRQLSPDTEEDKLPFSKHSDVFALGTIWYELHAREWPFKTQPAEAIIWQMGTGMKPNLSQIGMGKEISDILLFCWAFEQEERPTFTKLMDMLEKLPKRNRRLSHPGHFWKSAE